MRCLYGAISGSVQRAIAPGSSVPGGIVGAEWEVSYGFPDDAPELHYFLVDADTAEEAVVALHRLLERHGGFERLVASELIPPLGWKGLGPGVERPDWMR